MSDARRHLPDWQLPAGVNRGLWDYVHDRDLARQYDARLAGSPLVDVDVAFVEEHCPTPGRLLDLGCGTGRLLVPLARRGYFAVGVDLSREMLAVAQGKATAAGVRVQLVEGNITQLEGFAEASFDHVACLFSTLGMVLGAANRQRCAEGVFRLLRPGGIFVLHVHNRWWNLWDGPGRRWLLWDWWTGTTADRERGDRRMETHQGIAGLTLHLFTRREAARLLTEAGFSIREVRPVGLGGKFSAAWWFGGLRAYGYLIAAQRPA